RLRGRERAHRQARPPPLRDRARRARPPRPAPGQHAGARPRAAAGRPLVPRPRRRGLGGGGRRLRRRPPARAACRGRGRRPRSVPPRGRAGGGDARAAAGQRQRGARRGGAHLPARGRGGSGGGGVRRLGVAAALTFAAMPSGASAATVTAGALTATVHASPWHVEYNAVDEAPGSLAFTAGGVTARATRAVGGHMVGRAYVATLRTTDPQGRTIAVRIVPAGNGIITVDATGPPDADTMAVRFARQGGERFLGFGERSDQVVRSRGEVQNRVTEGPYQPSENAIVRAFVPPQGFNDRADATYFPI